MVSASGKAFKFKWDSLNDQLLSFKEVAESNPDDILKFVHGVMEYTDYTFFKDLTVSMAAAMESIIKLSIAVDPILKVRSFDGWRPDLTVSEELISSCYEWAKDRACSIFTGESITVYREWIDSTGESVGQGAYREVMKENIRSKMLSESLTVVYGASDEIGDVCLRLISKKKTDGGEREVYLIRFPSMLDEAYKKARVRNVVSKLPTRERDLGISYLKALKPTLIKLSETLDEIKRAFPLEDIERLGSMNESDIQELIECNLKYGYEKSMNAIRVVSDDLKSMVGMFG